MSLIIWCDFQATDLLTLYRKNIRLTWEKWLFSSEFSVILKVSMLVFDLSMISCFKFSKLLEENNVLKQKIVHWYDFRLTIQYYLLNREYVVLYSCEEDWGLLKNIWCQWNPIIRSHRSVSSVNPYKKMRILPRSNEVDCRMWNTLRIIKRHKVIFSTNLLIILCRYSP